MDIKDKRFLVIGGAGFIGSHTVDLLLENQAAEVIIYDNFCRGDKDNLGGALADPRVKIFPLGGDILHRDVLNTAMNGIDGVFHFAALWLLHCYEYPRSAFEVNIGGTFNVIEACINNGVGKLVYSSSASVYGDALEEPMTEDHPYNNKTFYGATKIAGEHMCRALYHRYKDEDKRLDYVGLRYMNVYGPRQDYRGAYISVIMKMLDRIDNGKAPIIHGDGSQAYDFIYVGDCAAANLAAMKSDAVDEFYNVGTGQRTTVLELAKMLLALTESKLELEFEPGTNIFVKNRVGSTEKAREELSFTAKQELQQGIKELIAWREANKMMVDRRRDAVGSQDT
jgi:UDP-glucose 4-epimerase